MATHSSILAWKNPTEEPGGLQSKGSQTVRHDLACMHAPYKLDMRDKGDLCILKLKCTSKSTKFMNSSYMLFIKDTSKTKAQKAQ